MNKYQLRIYENHIFVLMNLRINADSPHSLYSLCSQYSFFLLDFLYSAYHAYMHPPATELEPSSKSSPSSPTSAASPATEQPSHKLSSRFFSKTVAAKHDEEHVTAPSSIQPSIPETSSRPFSDTENSDSLHSLWLLFLPFMVIIIVISIVFCYQDTVKKGLVRWSDKLRNITMSFHTSNDGANRWTTQYFVLSSSPPESPSDEGNKRLGFTKTKMEVEVEEEDTTLLFDKSWPYPYNATTV